MKSSTRVIVNTIVQYIRSGLTIIISLFTVRIVLHNIGANDFGIYNLVAGVISMLSFVQVNLARTNQRFLSLYIGKGQKEIVTKVFNNSFLTQLIISLFICGLLYFFKDIVIDSFLNIPKDRITDAKIVFIIMIITLFFNLLSTPYYALLIAHENIIYSSIVQIIDAILKIPIALSLFYIDNSKLIVYTMMMSIISVVNFISYLIYSLYKYQECRILNIKCFDYILAKEMLSYMVWTIYGTFCIVGRSQGIAVILNKAFSTVVNAAYGIGNQIVSQVSFLSVSITNAINPQIIKSEGANNRERVFRLSTISSKYTFLLLSICLVPLFVYIEYILDIWLIDVPNYTACICRWIIIISLVDWTTQSLVTISTAVGNVKQFNLIINTIVIITVPLAYISIFLLENINIVMGIYLFVTIIVSFSRIIFLKYTTNFPASHFCKQFVYCVFPIVIINFLGCILINNYLGNDYLFVSFLFSIIITFSGVLFTNKSEDEKTIIRNFIKKIK